MQALLGTPGDGGDFGRKGLLESLLPEAEMWTVTVMPSGLDENTTQVRVAGLGDCAAAALGAARALRGHEARVAHDGAGLVEASEGAELGGKRDGRDLGDAPQGLESIDNGFEMRWRSLDGFVDGGFESLDSLALVIDLQDVIEQNDVLFGVRHLQSPSPLPPGSSPSSALL